jgi:hypothetical protein
MFNKPTSSTNSLYFLSQFLKDFGNFSRPIS